MIITRGTYIKPFEPFAEERLGGFRIPAALDPTIQDVALLIDGPPAGVACAIAGEEDFIAMPLIPALGTSASQLIGIRVPDLQTPLAHGFIPDAAPTGAEELFHVAIAEAETAIEPYRRADDLDREAVVLLAVDGWRIHVPSMPHRAQPVEADQPVDNARKHAGKRRVCLFQCVGGPHWISPTSGIASGTRHKREPDCDHAISTTSDIPSRH